ncbi:MAG: GCN5-related N-acetyltransferase, partial [Lacrimispora sp.]|nr:GCN5-related N-acetyltransferase [Lacrimispora sp.]
MESDRLYRVQKKDIEKLKQLLTECFEGDPLYCNLIPDTDT